MTWPILLITGTSSGIGLSTAMSAAAAGFTVVATMRDTAKSVQLKAAANDAGVTVDIQPLDVTDQASIEACFTHIQSTYGRLDAVLNNAGSGHVGTTEVDSLDAVRDVMEVNFFGVVAVTRAAMPMLRESRGRLATVSSVGGVIGQPFNEAYCAAKFAVEGYLESLAPRANVSLGALQNLELGKGARIATLVQVLRALDREYWLDTLEPEPLLGPLDLLEGRDAPAEPRRASRKQAT